MYISICMCTECVCVRQLYVYGACVYIIICMCTGCVCVRQLCVTRRVCI